MRLYVILKVESRPVLSSASCRSPESDRDLVSVQAVQAPLSAFHPLMNTWQAYKTIQVEILSVTLEITRYTVRQQNGRQHS
mgnify:CR=1 FL=1